jgi:hypothetical protein
LDQTIPTYGYVEKKGDEIMNALKEADKWEDKQHKEKQVNSWGNLKTILINDKATACIQYNIAPSTVMRY